MNCIRLEPGFSNSTQNPKLILTSTSIAASNRDLDQALVGEQLFDCGDGNGSRVGFDFAHLADEATV